MGVLIAAKARLSQLIRQERFQSPANSSKLSESRDETASQQGCLVETCFETRLKIVLMQTTGTLQQQYNADVTPFIQRAFDARHVKVTRRAYCIRRDNCVHHQPYGCRQVLDRTQASCYMKGWNPKTDPETALLSSQ